MSNAQALTAITEAISTSFFDVREETLVTASGVPVPGKKVIVRGDSGTPLAVVGDRYKTVTNEEIFTSFTDILANSSLNLDGAKVIMNESHGGARTFAQIILPEHQITIGEKDATALRIIARNSYDGSTAFIAQAGGYRFVCSNGQILGDTVSYFQSKHVQSLDVKAAAANISAVLDSFERSQEWFDSMRSKPVAGSQAYACLAFAARNAEALRLGYPDKYEDMPPMMRTLFDSWTAHSKALGANAWALYNTLTHFSSHWDSEKESSHPNAAAAKFRREERVRETLNSLEWTQLAA